jgi:hypothetical protein
VQRIGAHICVPKGVKIHALEANLRGFESLNFFIFLMNDE